MKPQYRIVLSYLLFGSLWIFVSDHVVDVLFAGREDMVYVQSLKGWLFVLVTALLLFFLIRRDFEHISHLNVRLTCSYDQAILGWVKLMDARHKETADHAERVAQMTLALARLMGIGCPQRLENIRRGAILHDVGKIGVADSILTKPGRLDPHEWDEMVKHPGIAYDMLSQIDFLADSVHIPYCHHEKWDGSGYPQGLKGEQIPLEARIFAVVDVWDALINPRAYKHAWLEVDVLDYLREQAGHHLDPEVVQVFLDNYDLLKADALVVP